MAARWGLWGGLAAFLIMLILPAPAGMPVEAWHTTALVVLMATWWMTQALPLTATAFLPFLLLPMLGVMSATDAAGNYYSPILFLVLGGAIIALAIERTGLHRRLALAIVSRGGTSPDAMLLAFMVASAILSMIVSNTATTLIMIPIAVAVLRAASIPEGETAGFAGALVLGIAFSASIGGLGTLVGSPTNAIAAGIMNRLTGTEITFLTWAAYGLPLVAATVPLSWLIIKRVQKLSPHDFDHAAARSGIGESGAWSIAESRLVPLVLAVVVAWIVAPLAAPFLPAGALTDGTIAILGAMLLFVIPDGTGRPLLTWKEADRAPWGVIMMFGGGLALASGIGDSGLAVWVGTALEPMAGVHPVIIALVLVAIVILVTEFASNVASASSAMPVVAGLALATGADPYLLAMPAAMAASWAFMLPSGTGPNAIAWATGHVALPRLLMAGLMMNLMAAPLIVGIVWMMRTLLG
jgi:solute carrier family 13 (sodium-dependent dicarboxylate transporter), member 2/3/5